MARTNNLTNYLTDVADAIREKKGTTDVIPANTFDEEIKNLPSGGGDVSDYFETTVTLGNYQFFGAGAMIKKIPDITVSSNITSLVNFFRFYRGTYIPKVSNTSHITDMSYMFAECDKITKIDTLFDTSSCKKFNCFFYNCTNLTSLPDTINTSEATAMYSMFYNCARLKNVPNIDTSKVTNMSCMFYNCNQLTSIQILNASSNKDISSIFSSCDNLEDLGGLQNLGQSFLTAYNANYYSYTLNLSSCNKLTHDSLMNVINNLYDIASAGIQAQQLVLGSTNLAKLTADEIAIATNKGWNVS